MKKFFSILLLLCGAALFAEEYNFIALGDIHFDGAAYHKDIPEQSYKKQERARNIDMWENGKSIQVLTAAANAAGEKTAFIAQAGDFTQGDSDSVELQEQMFKDAFTVVKKHFPNHKLFPVKGNHDVRVEGVKGYCNTPAERAFLPLIAKELGRKSVKENYIVKHGQDLFIFHEGFSGARKAELFLKKALADNQDARYVFFITHLPVLPCTPRNPGWLVSPRDRIISMLAARNAVIITAHTHKPSFISVKTPEGTLSQLVICSMGNQWNPNGKPTVKSDDFAAFLKEARAAKNVSKNSLEALNVIEKFTVTEFNMFSGHSGFAVIKVDAKNVVAELYTGNSGKPWIIKNLCTNAKMENKK